MKLLVVVPIHDRTEFIGEALDSIAQQTRLPDEVVVTGNVRDIPQHPLSEKMAVLGTVTEDPLGNYIANSLGNWKGER